MVNLLLILNIFILESLLNVDNATVLAIMVKDLPENKRNKALRYGIGGAFLFRGICLFLASWLIKLVWLKVIGGIYLLYLTYTHFTPKKDSLEEGIDKEHNSLFLKIKNKIGLFWSTIILVEIMDLAFSIDNIFAAVAMTNNLIIILIGVGIGIVSMRFIAGWFSKLIIKYPSLERSAFIVIGLLGLKLIILTVFSIESSHTFDFIFSGIMMLIFFLPITSKGFIKRISNILLGFGGVILGILLILYLIVMTFIQLPIILLEVLLFIPYCFIWLLTGNFYSKRLYDYLTNTKPFELYNNII